MSRYDIRLTLMGGAFLALGVSIMSGFAASEPPEAPTNLVAQDVPLDGGGVVDLKWDASATPISDLKGYEIRQHELSSTSAQQGLFTSFGSQTDQQADAEAKAQTEKILEGEGIAPEDANQIARERDSNLVHVPIDESKWKSVGVVPPTQLKYQVTGLDKDKTFVFAIRAIGSDGAFSKNSNVSAKTEPVAGIINAKKIPLFIILAIICGAVLLFVILARRGMVMKIRTIAGLKAVDEAVGRATEMGRSILFINGIQDMDDLQTVAGVTVLGHVAKTAAEYDAKIEVPTSRSLVMTAAREAVQSSYFAAGQADSYNPDLIYYVTDEQFGFVAYVSGMMTREKPAACFYMGSFFAESLILAETGNSVGAIQIAGTANPSQLPFFVAACDYTLIGEEFFAASAYLSGQPDQLGSLKGQDVGKILVGILIIIGVALATLAAITAEMPVAAPFHDAMTGAVDYLVNVILGK